ncbi:cytochrome P450 [Saccharopolyspora erythraea]|nr:cytochrome P450 [Saccharopolyspora erythraea]
MPTSTESASQAPFLDVTDPGFTFEAPEVARARERHWYARTPVGPIVLRHAEVQELIRDPRLVQDGARYLAMHGITSGPVHDWFVPLILHRSGDDHLRLRRVVQKSFTPRVVNNLRPFMRATAERLADRIAAEGACEFVEAFADPYPVAVMCELLGVPPQDYELFHRCSTDIGLVFSLSQGDGVRERVERGVVELYAYVDSLIARRRAAPTGDLVSRMISAHEDDARLSSEELRNLVVALVFAGHDTTRHQLGRAMVALCAHSEQWTALRDEPRRADAIVEELLRLFPTVPAIFRFATEDLEYRDIAIPAGTFVMLCVQSAHRDVRAFGPEAESFDPATERGAAQMVFGGGPHFCLGAATARAELAEALPVLARRLGAPTPAGPVTWRPPIGIHGPESLPLRFN